MIEIYRKGFRLDIDPAQVVTFKKSQNLNGVQARYAYSNTIKVELTANNRKLLELPELPTGKVQTLQNGFTVDVILNGSIQLRNQTLNVQKENKKDVDLYLLYSDNALVVKLKEQYVNSIVSDFKYRKNLSDFIFYSENNLARTAFVETQEKSGLFVMEEMPRLISIKEIIRRIFTSNGYAVYGDFFEAGNDIEDYYVAPNQGIYQIYSGSEEGFPPNFDPTLSLFQFLNDTLKLVNSYADVDDTYRTVIINQWTNLGNFKTNYVDYSKYYLDYQDYDFKSSLAKRNEMTFSDSGTLYNSFFNNNLSSQEKATYLSSGFGTGPLNIFEDSDIEEDGSIAVRANGAVGETSAVRIFRISSTYYNLPYYVGGVKQFVPNRKAIPVSMRDIYTQFHKGYIDFILTPLIQNIIFRYDEILAATFSMTKVFFIDKLASYWIPLEINFTTKKDNIVIKAMLIKQRKVPAPILNNFNSVLLDFREKTVFPLELLLSMYPMPPNEYPWETVIFKSYDQDKNSLFINDVLLPADSLPVAFAIADIVSIKIESDKPGDTIPNKDTDSLYIQAIDSNGGISNDAYITLKHTGVGRFESNFIQLEDYLFGGDVGSGFKISLMPLTYILGTRPNLNDTISSVTPLFLTTPESSDAFNLVEASEIYTSVKVQVPAFELTLGYRRTLARPKLIGRLKVYDGTGVRILREVSIAAVPTSPAGLYEHTFTVAASETNIASLAPGKKIRAYIQVEVTSDDGSTIQDAKAVVRDLKVNISTTKTF